MHLRYSAACQPAAESSESGVVDLQDLVEGVDFFAGYHRRLVEDSIDGSIDGLQHIFRLFDMCHLTAPARMRCMLSILLTLSRAVLAPWVLLICLIMAIESLPSALPIVTRSFDAVFCGAYLHRICKMMVRHPLQTCPCNVLIALLLTKVATDAYMVREERPAQRKAANKSVITQPAKVCMQHSVRTSFSISATSQHQ